MSRVVLNLPQKTLQMDVGGGAWGQWGEAEARQLPSSELKRKIKHEIMEVTGETIMKYINLGKAAQWAIKYEIRLGGRVEHIAVA